MHRGQLSQTLMVPTFMRYLEFSFSFSGTDTFFGVEGLAALNASLSSLHLTYRPSLFDWNIKYFAENDVYHIWIHPSVLFPWSKWISSMIGHRYIQFIQTFITINTAFSSSQEYKGRVNDVDLAFNAPLGSFDTATSSKDSTNAIPMVTLDQSVISNCTGFKK